jgi:hypothetical protein
MADMKEIKVTATSERYAAKFHKALELMQKGGIGGQGGGFTEKTFKAMNRELDKMVKAFGKIGVDVRDVAKGMSETWAKSIKNNTKSLEQYGKLLKKTGADATRAGAVAGRLGDPGYRASYISKFMANADKDPYSTPAAARAKAEENLNRRQAMAESKRDSASEARKQTAELALQQSIDAQEARQQELRSRVMGVATAISGAAQLGAMALRGPTERYRNTTQGTRTASQFYDRFAQGDLAMAATLNSGGQEAIAAGEREEAASYLSSGARLAIGGGLIIGGAFTGGATSMLGLGLLGAGATSFASGAFDLATGKAGSEKQKATAEYLELMNQNDPRRKRILTDAAQNATGYASYLGQFGGGIDQSVESGNAGNNFGRRFSGMAAQAQKFGLNWRDTMGMHADLSRQYGTQNASSMMPAVTSAEQVLGMSGASVSGAIGTSQMAGNTRATAQFIEILAKGVAKGMDQTKMREDFAAMVASFETSSLGRTPGAGAFAADVALGGLNMKDMGQLPVMMQAMRAMDAVTGAQTGEMGVMNRGFASQAVADFMAEQNAKRKKHGMKPVSVDSRTRYGLEDELQQASLGSIATGNLGTAEQALSGLFQRDAFSNVPIATQLSQGLVWDDGVKKDYLKHAGRSKIQLIEAAGGVGSFQKLLKDIERPGGSTEATNVFRQLTQRSGMGLTQDVLREGGAALIRATNLAQQGINAWGNDPSGKPYMTEQEKEKMALIEKGMAAGGGSDFGGVSAEVAGAMNQMFQEMKDPGVRSTLDGMRGVLGVLLGASSRASDIKALVDALGPLAKGTPEEKQFVDPMGN